VRRFTILLSFFILLSSACTLGGLAGNTPAPTMEIQTQPQAEARTEIPSPTPATPTNSQILAGPNIDFNGIRFTLDPAIGSRLYVFDDVTTIDGLTAHNTRFALTSEEYCQTWCLMVYPITDFTRAFGTFVFPPAGYRGGAAIIFKAKEISFSFQNGNGDRGIETFGQDHYKVSNESLKYVFRGYNADKQYGVFLQAPIHASNLLDVPPTTTTNGNPAQDMLEYNQQAAHSMNALRPADFIPNLDLLDALVASIYIRLP
jgi:hypothetical protein